MRIASSTSSAVIGTLSVMMPSTRFQSMFWVRVRRWSYVSSSRPKRMMWWPCARRDFSMALTRVAKNHRVRNGATTATTLVRPEARDVAVGDAT